VSSLTKRVPSFIVLKLMAIVEMKVGTFEKWYGVPVILELKIKT
jgi:hypothetical protein